MTVTVGVMVGGVCDHADVTISGSNAASLKRWRGVTDMNVMQLREMKLQGKQRQVSKLSLMVWACGG